MLFSEKTLGTVIALASLLSSSLCKNWYFAISLLLQKIFIWNTDYPLTIQRAIHITPRETIQNAEFCPLSRCSLGVVVVQKLWHFVISLLLLKILTWKSEYVYIVQRAIHTFKGNWFFFSQKNDSFFRLRIFSLYQAPHSRALAPAYSDLNLFPNKPWFLLVCSTNLLKTLKTLRERTISPFPTVFSTLLENFLSFSSHLKLSSANCFSLEESKIYRLGKG